MAIGRLKISELTDGGESKGFMLLVTYNLHKSGSDFAQALLSDGENTVFAIDNKLGEANHKYPESKDKSVVYVKLSRNGEAYSIENILPANDPIISGSCSFGVEDFIAVEKTEPVKKKKTSFADLRMNEKVAVQALVISSNLKKSSFKPFVEVNLSDGNTTIYAKDFTSRPEDYVQGIVIEAEIRFDKYGYTIEKFSTTEASPVDFIKRSPIDERTMYDEITSVLMDLIDRYGENSIADIGLKLYEENEEKLLFWSASKSMHHDLYGGLLYHTYRMMKLGEKMLEVYSNANEELLLTAIAIHDLGKLVELNTDKLGVATYTDEGNLLGHTVIGLEMIDRLAQKGDYDAEKVMLLKHCVGSHHGKLEFNAVTLPKIEEAFLLHIIDYTDSRVYMFEDAYKNIPAGQSAEKRDIGLEAVVYRPTFAKEEEDN